MEWRLREAAVDDAKALALVAGATFLETYSHRIGAADMLAHLAGKASPGFFRAWIADPGVVLTIAEAPVGLAPLAYTVLTQPDLPVERRDGDIELRRIYALATSWGTGLGGALMARVLADARAVGARRVLLGTHPENVRAHRFYEKHGFVVIGRRTFRVGAAAFDDPVYALDL